MRRPRSATTGRYGPKQHVDRSRVHVQIASVNGFSYAKRSPVAPEEVPQRWWTVRSIAAFGSALTCESVARRFTTDIHGFQIGQ
jgi:hypothetical protein